MNLRRSGVATKDTMRIPKVFRLEVTKFSRDFLVRLVMGFQNIRAVGIVHAC